VGRLAGRIGVRFANTFAAARPYQPALVTAWLRPNLWHEF